MTNDTNGWAVHQKLVESELARGSQERREIIKELASIARAQAAAVEVRSSMRDDIRQNRDDIGKMVVIQTAQGERLTSLSMELKIKAGLWGGLGAAVPSAIAVIFVLLNK